jgi:hypothetical protein
MNVEFFHRDERERCLWMFEGRREKTHCHQLLPVSEVGPGAFTKLDLAGVDPIMVNDGEFTRGVLFGIEIRARLVSVSRPMCLQDQI